MHAAWLIGFHWDSLLLTYSLPSLSNLLLRHLKHHYEGHIDFDHLNYDEMRDEEIAFHYFKIHDTDNDNRLDGLEIMQAIMHNKDFLKLLDGERDEEDEDAYDDNAEIGDEERLQMHKEEQEWQNKPNEVMDEASIVEIVNQVLEDDDINEDGYIDFPEFIKSQDES